MKRFEVIFPTKSHLLSITEYLQVRKLNSPFDGVQRFASVSSEQVNELVIYRTHRSREAALCVNFLEIFPDILLYHKPKYEHSVYLLLPFDAFQIVFPIEPAYAV